MITLKQILRLIKIFLLFALISSGCAPYSLPEQHTPADETALGYYQDSFDDYQQGNYEEAQKKIDQAIQLNPKFAQFFQLKGDIERALKNDELALIAYQNAIRSRSNLPDVYQSMAEIYFSKGKYDESVRSYRKILAADELRMDIYLEIAECYIQVKEYQIALNQIEDYLRLTSANAVPVDDRYLFLRAKIYYERGEFRAAIGDLSAYNKNHPQDKRSLSMLGYSYFVLNEHENGLSYFNRLVQMEPESGEWYLQRGIYFLYKEDYNDAKSQIERALELDGNLNAAYYYLGRIYEEQENIDQALEAYIRYQENAGDEVFPDVVDRIRVLQTRKNM